MRVDDAVHAVKSAAVHGVVPGGGLTLYNAREHVTSQHAGASIVRDALSKPIMQIIENCGGTVPANLGGDIGYTNGTAKHIMNAGIMDPAQVVKCALQHAASITGLVLTTSVIIK